MKKMSNEWGVLRVKTWCYITGFQLAKTKKCCRCLFPCEMLPLWDLFQMCFVFPNTEYKLFFLSSTDSPLFFCFTVCISLLWLWSWAHHSWNTGLGLVCHSVVWMHPFPLCLFPVFIHSHRFSSVWPEFSCRFTQRLGNTRNKVSLHDIILQNNKTPNVSPSWEPRPLCNQVRASQTQNMTLISLLQRKRGRRWLGS